MAKKPTSGDSTDDEKFPLKDALDGVTHKFCELRQLAEGVASNKLRHLLVIGPQGIGKTHTMEAVLEHYSHPNRGNILWKKVTGHVSPLAMYQILYEMRHKRCIVLFDDCDSVWKISTSLNILKGATDTRPVRKISWETTSVRNSVPGNFVFDGRLIITTNHQPKGPASEPLLDRFMVYNLALRDAERVAWVITILEQKYRKHPESRVLDDVISFLLENHPRIGKSLTLRTAIKAVELAMFRTNWKELADTILLEDR